MKPGDAAYIEVRAEEDGEVGIRKVHIATVEVHPAEGTYPPEDWRSTSGRYRLYRFEEAGSPVLPEGFVFETAEAAEAVAKARCKAYGFRYIGLV